jgi:DNA-binding CsgD family transcriptional regulator
MENRQSAEKQLSSALQYLHLVIVEKGAATEELQANNHELAAILDGLLSVRGDLRTMIAEDVSHGTDKPNGRLKTDLKLLDLAQLQQRVEETFEKSRAAIEQSTILRMKSQKVRAALLAAQDGHAKASFDGHHDGTPHPGYDQLSKRERQVLSLIVAGKSSKQIAAELGISFKTAVTHRASIMGKMEVHEIASVVREAIRRGLA